MSTNTSTAAARGAGAAVNLVLLGRSAAGTGDLSRTNANAQKEDTMTMQMTRLQHECAETATGSYAHPARQEETPWQMSHTPQRDAVTAHLDHLAARISRLEVAHAAPRSDAVCLQVTISHLAPQSTPVRVHGPELTAACSRRDRVRWPRYRAG